MFDLVPLPAANQEPPLADGLAVSHVLSLTCVGVSKFLGDAG